MARSLATSPHPHDAIVRRGHIGRGRSAARATVRDLPRRRGAGNLVAVEGSGPFNFGDFPDDPDDSAPEDEIRRQAWLPPEDRLWRHPSEVAQHGHPQGGNGIVAPGPRSPRRDHRFVVTAGVVGAAAVATAVVVAFTLTSSPSVVTATHAVTTAHEASFIPPVATTGITSPLVDRMEA